jgi:hypothetical protein
MSQQTNKSVMVQGRIVQVYGDLFAGGTAKIYGTQQDKLNKAGQPYKEYGFSLAVPKTILADQAALAEGQPGYFWTVMHEVASSFFADRRIPANFKMKWKDGDTGVTDTGIALNTKKGYPGHIVLSCKTSSSPMKFFKFIPGPVAGSGDYMQISDGIKCGDYVQVQLGISGHTGTNAGLYLNPYMVLLLGAGEEIINAPSASQVFGNAPPVMASTAPAAYQAPTVAHQPPVHQHQPPTAPPVQHQPHHGVLPAQFQQPPQPTSAPAFPPPFPGPR